MADISMCRNRECPVRDLCYRFTARADLLQAYAVFEWEDCNYFWDNGADPNAPEVPIDADI
jgi:hypothetical protein